MPHGHHHGIRIGDVVRLKSGGPEMVVIDLESTDLVRCIWAHGTEHIRRDTVPVAAVEKQHCAI